MENGLSVAADTGPGVDFAVHGGVGRITLNRPEALHALNHAMCMAMISQLLVWRADPEIRIVVIDHAGKRGFCAGGDVRMLAQSGAGDGSEARRFFSAEYQLNHLLFSFPKPVLTFMDGVTMGGGVGISIHGHLRVATERTLFAMPESGLGLFPDVGGGWFLPRLPGRIGLYLALSGARLKAADCLYAGIATHVVPSERLPDLKAALFGAQWGENPPMQIEYLLSEEALEPGMGLLEPHRNLIDLLFSFDDVLEIFTALEYHGSEWAAQEFANLQTKSPQTLCVAIRQLARGSAMVSFAENMAMEYRIACRVVHLPDFQEGVRAILIDKDNAPKWHPASIRDVTPAYVDAIFAPLPAGEEWRPLAL